MLEATKEFHAQLAALGLSTIHTEELVELRKDKVRLDRLEREVNASQYTLELAGGCFYQSNGIRITTGIGSGPWQKVIEGPSGESPLRRAIDKMKSE